MAGESAQDKASRARQKAERLTRYAEAWEKGAVGESRTAQALAELGPEWTVWHDLRWPGRRFANIDHLVIGPGGIFVIDSENWSGSLSVEDGVLRQNGRRREQAVAGCADSALAVGELLPQHLENVRPVLCFTRDEPVDGWARDVMLCSTANVVTMLTTRQPTLSAAQVATVSGTLQGCMRSALAPAPTTPTPDVAEHPRPGRRAHSSPRVSKPVGLLIRLAFILLTIMLFIGVATLLPDVLINIARR